jgi:deazaflavin-dependent oxidoreductase (nitroreductase family)
MTTDPFPDVRWGNEGSRFGTAAAAVASTGPGSWLLRTLTPLDRRLLRRTRGRFTVLGPFGAPTMLLTTTGAKSGLPRTSPLLYVREPGRLYVVGSNFGQERHPAWSGNLLADPHATVTIGGVDVPVVATRLEGAERDRVWQLFVDLAKTYDAYRDRTDRDIRVFALDPVTPAG